MSWSTASPGHAAIVFNPVKMSQTQIRRIVQEHERRHGWPESRWYATGAQDSGRGAAHEALADNPAP